MDLNGRAGCAASRCRGALCSGRSGPAARAVGTRHSASSHARLTPLPAAVAVGGPRHTQLRHPPAAGLAHCKLPVVVVVAANPKGAGRTRLLFRQAAARASHASCTHSGGRRGVCCATHKKTKSSLRESMARFCDGPRNHPSKLWFQRHLVVLHICNGSGTIVSSRARSRIASLLWPSLSC